MKTLLATSALTFVPDNYDGLVLPLLQSPLIGGLLLVDNREPAFLAKGLALMATGAAPAFGAQLWRNWFSGSIERRRQMCVAAGKEFLMTADPNADDVVAWIKERNFDLILNARTRSFFKKKLLAAAKRGCLNIHHGLLPEQRGLMCDFWAHLEGTPSGFSVHVMTSKLDDGPILKAVEVKTDQTDYMESLRIGARREAEECLRLLEEISSLESLPPGIPNRSDSAVYRRNPGLMDFYKLGGKGIRR